MWPDAPSSLSGAYEIGAVDEQVQGRVLTRLGEPWGVWYDDTTTNLDRWVQAGLEKYGSVGRHVMVCVPPGEPHHHWPAPVISVYEAYIYGMGVPPAEWLPLPRFDAYCVQWLWPGTSGRRQPSPAERERLLQLVQAERPRFIFLF